MRYLIFGLIVGLMMTQCHSANASDLKVKFKSNHGAEISLEQAFKLSAQGETVYRCQPVKATVNKSGTSVSFKVVK